MGNCWKKGEDVEHKRIKQKGKVEILNILLHEPL